jgi:transcriptional regulator with XRE-family HTH domain
MSERGKNKGFDKDALKAIMRRRKLTARQLAEQIGVSRHAVHRWMCGQRIPGTLDTFVRLCAALRCDARALLQKKSAKSAEKPIDKCPKRV